MSLYRIKANLTERKTIGQKPVVMIEMGKAQGLDNL
jgi:hypothetical protein